MIRRPPRSTLDRSSAASDVYKRREGSSQVASARPRCYAGAMRLYDNAFSPYAFKVRACLYEKGIAFEHHDLRASADHADLRRVNPRGEVPALEDGATVLYDSKVICEYLEE